jgi:ribose 5-phosphate isomerase B
MRVYLGSDHAGYDLKGRLVDHVRALGHEPIDCGPSAYDPDDDYPPYVLRAAEGVAGDPGSLGIVLGGSGNGEAMAANKVRGVRAAVVWTDETARLAREHNDANVISLGARMVDAAAALVFVTVFLTTAFSQGERHVRRIRMLADYESTRALPSLPSLPG